MLLLTLIVQLAKANLRETAAADIGGGGAGQSLWLPAEALLLGEVASSILVTGVIILRQKGL